MVWFFYFFSCVSQPFFFPRISIVLAINCIALITMSDFFFSSRLYAFPLCNHIYAKSDWVGSELVVRTGTLLYCTYKSLTHTPKTNSTKTSHNMTYITLVNWAKLEP
jgi:hypothetical protein